MSSLGLVEISKWEIFCKVNYDTAITKIYNNKKKKHYLNLDSLMLWRKESLEKTDIDIMKVLIDTIFRRLRHITFIEFYTQLMLVVSDVVNYVTANKAKYKRIVLKLDTSPTKSTTWIGILCSYVLNTVLTHVNPDSYFEPQKEDLMIFLDDMSYSGTQMKGTLNNMPPGTNAILCIPFMSTHSYRLLYEQNLNFVYKSPQTEQIYSIGTVPKLNQHKDFKQYVGVRHKISGKMNTISDEEFKKELETNEYLAIGDIYLKVSLVYFDHKLADGWSSPIDLIVSGYLLQNGKLIKEENACKGNFILGCSKVCFKSTYSGAYKKDNECPRPPYKYIEYIGVDSIWAH